MASSGRRPGGLAARIVRVTLLIGTITVVVAGAVATIGASRLAANQVAARDQATLRLVEDRIVGRLTMVETLASQVAAASATTTDHAGLDARLEPIVQSGTGVVDRVIVAERRGKVLSAFPRTAEATSIASLSAYREAVNGVTGFRRDVNPDGTWGLWLTRAVVAPSGLPAVILLHVELAPLQAAVVDPGLDTDRALMVLAGREPLFEAGPTGKADIKAARFDAVSQGAGKARVPGGANQWFTGVYEDIQGLEGISWRILVIEPMSMIAGDTLIAVAPFILVLLLGAIVALATAWLLSQRMVAPLRTLETAAYRAATGAYVKPIPATADDEIGQVAVAFNAVALRLNALHDLSQLLASASQLDQVLDGILAAIGHIVGPGAAAIYLLDESGRWLVPARARGTDVSGAAAIDALGEGWLAHALRDPDPVVHSGDAHRLADELPGLADADSIALMAPLVSGHDALGVIVVLRGEGEPISEAEREMVRTFSAQAAIAVHNSRLFAVETESRRVAEALRSVAEQLVRPDGIEHAMREVQGVIGDLFGARSVAFAVVDRAALGLGPAADRAAEGQILGFAMRVLGRSGTVGPVVVQKGDDDGADRYLEKTESAELLVVPITLDSPHGAVLVVALAGSASGRRDVELAAAVANEIALALDNAYLYERALSRAANLETIFKISQAVGSSLQINVVLNRVLDVVQKILSADAVALLSYDARRRKIVTAMARGAVSPSIVDLKIAPGHDVPGYVFSSGEPAAFKDLHDSMGGIAGDAAAHGLRSLLAVPLLARGRSIGVLMVFSADVGAFSDEDMSILQTFATQAALAVDTARLYSREHEVATILKASILPDALPRFDEFDSASVYEPAGADADIGGDYYDLFRAPDGSLWFAIADVCGKGVVAATKTSMIKYSVRSLVAAGLGPAGVLGEVNRMVAETGDTSDIVTLWAGRYTPATHVLAWASGGHPPGMVLRSATGDTDRLAATGPLLGALADVVYGEESTQLFAGDIVLLYTDGVTEARSGNEFFGESRVDAVLRKGGTPDDIVAGLIKVVRRFVHGDLRDDVAVLSLAVRAEGMARDEGDGE